MEDTMAQQSTLFAAMDTFNGRAAAATGIGEGEHATASPQQWALTTTGLDIEAGELVAFAESLADAMGKTAQEQPHLIHNVLIDGLRQMFVMGALHEQERARREAASA